MRFPANTHSLSLTELGCLLSTHRKYTPIRYLEFFISQSKLVKKGRGIWMSNLKLMVLKPRDVLNPGKDAVSESGKVHANSTNDKSLCGLNLTHELLRGWKLPYNFLPLPLKLKKQDFNCTLCLFQHFWNCHHLNFWFLSLSIYTNTNNVQSNKQIPSITEKCYPVLHFSKKFLLRILLLEQGFLKKVYNEQYKKLAIHIQQWLNADCSQQ